MGATPVHYVENVPRVSSIVEAKFPFDGMARNKFSQWLEGHGITYDEYMEEASNGGTYVHSKLEQYALTKKAGRVKSEYKQIVDAGKQWLDESGAEIVSTEAYLNYENRYQGTCDAIVVLNGVKHVIDWKTYGLAKLKWGLLGAYKKPSSKLKKATLQLNLYGLSLGITNFAVVELTVDGYKYHSLPLMEKKDVLQAVRDYELNNAFSYIDEL